MNIERVPGWLLKSFFYGIIAGMIIPYVATRLPVAAAYWKARAPVRALAREAARDNITYDGARQTPAASFGKPVAWEGEPPRMPESSGTSSFEDSVVVRIMRISNREIVLKNALAANPSAPPPAQP